MKTLINLKKILKDKLHQPYRFLFIQNNEEIKQLNQDENTIAIISGSGPTVLLITPIDSTTTLSKSLLEIYRCVTVKVSEETKLEVLK